MTSPVVGQDGVRGFVNRGGFWRLVLVVVVYLALYLGAGTVGAQFVDTDKNDDVLASVSSVFFHITLGLLVGGAMLVAFALYMGWTRELFGRQAIYRSKWMWVAPVIVLTPVVMRIFGIDWGQHAADVVALVLVSGLMIGFVEELLYRGISVKMLRDGGHAERVVAALSALVFALSHAANLLGGQPISTVAPTVVYTFAFGVLMYLTMRVTGFLVFAMIAHGLTDPTTILAVGGVDKVETGSSLNGLLAGAGVFTAVLILAGFILLFFVHGCVGQGRPDGTTRCRLCNRPQWRRSQ